MDIGSTLTKRLEVIQLGCLWLCNKEPCIQKVIARRLQVFSHVSRIDRNRFSIHRLVRRSRPWLEEQRTAKEKMT